MKRPWIKTSFGFNCLRFLFIILSISQVTCIYFVWVPPLYSQRVDKQSAAVPVQQGVSPDSQPPNFLDLDHQQKELEAKIAEQKELLAFEKEHLSVLDNASRTLLTVAGVFAILLGLASWKALEDQRKAAQLELETQTDQITFDSTRYVLYSDAGHFTMYPGDSTLEQVSREYLLRAAELGASKQKVQINLAILELEKRPDKALEHLTKALNCTEYNEEKSQPKPHHAKYLQACAYTQQAKSLDEPERGKLLENAVNLLEEVAPLSDEWIRRVFSEGSPGEGPDQDVWFSGLAQDSRFKDRFNAAAVKMGSRR